MFVNRKQNINDKNALKIFQITTIDLLQECDYCEGEKKEWVQVENGRERADCTRCNGKGKLLLGQEYIKYQIAYLNRHIPYLWRILKHELEIPYEYMYDAYDECSHCNGLGKWLVRVSEDREDEVSCEHCHGAGSWQKGKDDIYKEIFVEFLENKKRKEEYIKVLENQEYKYDLYEGYNEEKPSATEWVCVKCTNFLDGTDGQGGMDSCSGCVNESMCWTGDNIYFKPINENAKQWYNNGGFKRNLSFQTKFDYKIK